MVAGGEHCQLRAAIEVLVPYSHRVDSGQQLGTERDHPTDPLTGIATVAGRLCTARALRPSRRLLRNALLLLGANDGVSLDRLGRTSRLPQPVPVSGNSNPEGARLYSR